MFILKVFVIAKHVVGPILERVYCCHRAKVVSASGVHKTQPKVPTPLVWYTKLYRPCGAILVQYQQLIRDTCGANYSEKQLRA